MKTKNITRNNFMGRFSLVFLIYFLLLQSLASAQLDTLRIASYNLLQFPDAEYATRLPYFRIVLNQIDADILVVQEMKSQEGVNILLNDVLNYYQAEKYVAAPFISGPDDDNAMFYKANKFSLLSNRQISTDLRDISEYVLYYLFAVDTTKFRVYSLDFKAYNDEYSQQRRYAESIILRGELNQLNPGTHFLACGSFNFYTATEQGFEQLTGIMSDNDGRCFDPINRTGNWYFNQSFADVHSQSTRTTEFGGGSNGGLDNRSDMMLISSAIFDGITYGYLNNSYTTLGNDEQHFQLDINDGTNQSVPDSVADALYYASDHLPLYLDITVSGNYVPVELANFEAILLGNHVNLSWTTATESDNYGFSIERKINSNEWSQVGFVGGQGTTAVPHKYSYVDNNVFRGELFYRLKQIDFDGQFTYSEVIQVVNKASANFSLDQNYPNPFNNSTAFTFNLPKKSTVKITLYDMLGKKVQIIANKEYEAGKHELKIDASSLKSGLYFYRLETSEFSDVKKFMLLK